MPILALGRDSHYLKEKNPLHLHIKESCSLAIFHFEMSGWGREEDAACKQTKS